MKKGRAHTMTHDYKRHGTTTLFAALNTLDGSVMATCMERHRHQQWLKVLPLIDRQTPADKKLHPIVDTYATHTPPPFPRPPPRPPPSPLPSPPPPTTSP